MSESDDSELWILFAVFLAFILIVIILIPIEIEASREHAAFCAAKGMTDGFDVEHHGKTSTTHKFCYDANGAVYYYGR